MNNEGRVLIVDDEKHIRVTLAEVVRGMGFETSLAATGEEALAILSDGDVWLTLLDLRLPGLNGIEVLRRGREISPHTVFTIITAHGTVDVAVETMKEGASDFLQKPFTPDQVRGLIRSIQRREAMRSADDYDALISQAVEAITTGDLAQARERLDHALAIERDRPEVHNLLGVVYDVVGDRFQAQQSYRDALSADPTYEPARANLHRSVDRDDEGSYILQEAKKQNLREGR